MKPMLLITLLTLPSVALSADPCGPAVGPAPPPDYCAPTPNQLCLGSAACVPVRYVVVYPDGDATHDWFQHAYSTVDNYPVTGWAGPCRVGWDCSLIANQAFEDLHINALRILRSRR